MISALEALERLKTGNQRFASGVISLDKLASANRRNDLVSGQAPFAIILGCSDSRVPAELIFNQGLGDLFVIRVAGNIVAPSQVGSVEFAAECFHSPLVVVLGHSCCGAVAATLSELRRPKEQSSRNLRSIVNRIKPAVVELLQDSDAQDEEHLMQRAVRANVRASVSHLRHGSEILEQLTENNGLLIVGAEYSLDTGVVTFFDEFA